MRRLFLLWMIFTCLPALAQAKDASAGSTAYVYESCKAALRDSADLKSIHATYCGAFAEGYFMGVMASSTLKLPAPDPKDPNIVYGGRVIKFNKRTGQSQVVAPEILRSGKVRFIRTMPLLFHPADDNMLLFGTNIIFKTLDGGQTWQEISPDLTRKQPEIPASVGNFKTKEMEQMAQRAIVYALGPSPLNKNIIWAGTDDGLVHVTTDGGDSWKEVTPPQISSWDKISQIDAGHFDEGTAYIAVNAIRKDDMRPLVFKTHDFGKTWEGISNGMNPMGPVNAVREDHITKGLLFAGTEREVYFSVDDGANWQSLRMNMPASSIRDLVIHENDLVIGTHGRSIWILDDFSSLRELTKISNDAPHLFQPSLATRVRFNMFADTPLPPEEPTGENPPDGALIDYHLPTDTKEVSLEILDATNQLVNKFSSQDVLQYPDSTKLPHPTYWIRPLSKPSTKKGHQRFVWNLRYADPPGANRSYAIAAVLRNTPVGPVGPFVAPGTYRIRLTVDGVVDEKDIVVRLDPRSQLSDTDLKLQTALSMDVYNAYGELHNLREVALMKLENKKLDRKKKSNLSKFVGSGDPNNGDPLYGSIRETNLEDESLVGLQEKLLYLLVVLQNADTRPTKPTQEAVKKLVERTHEMQSKLKSISK